MEGCGTERVGLDHSRQNRSPAAPPRIRAASPSGTTSEYPSFVRHNCSKPPAADRERCDENKTDCPPALAGCNACGLKFLQLLEPVENDFVLSKTAVGRIVTEHEEFAAVRRQVVVVDSTAELE